MATTVTFNDMLKKYMPYNLLREEIVKRDFFLMSVQKDQNWKGGEMQVPFRGGAASSFKFGGLKGEDAITEGREVLGTVSGYKELWGSMVFNDSDLSKHDSMEQSFIKILPDQIEEFVDGMKEIVSNNLLNGEHFDTTTVAGTALGVIISSRPERYTLGQYVVLESGHVGYVTSINMNTGAVALTADLDLAGAVVDLTSEAGDLEVSAADDKCYIEGASASSFTSLPNQLLSAANGGSSTLFGKTKLAYPLLQAYNYSGTAIDADTILAKIFDAQLITKRIGKGNPSVVLMSYKHMASCMAILETSRDYVAKDTKASVYGWTEIDVMGVKGSLKLVAVNEMNDDIMPILDWTALKLHSNGMFERRTSPSGNQFYEVRATTGFKYIVDIRFFGELVISKPSHCGIIHTISY